MGHSHRRVAGSLIVLVSLLSACATVEEESTAGEGAARTESIEGTDLVRVIMTEEAVERLDMQWVPVRDAGRAGETGGSKVVIPYSALFYGPNGETWTYTNPEPLTFERSPIEVDDIVGNRVFLSDGPASGIPVVTRGSAELFGIETGIDES